MALLVQIILGAFFIFTTKLEEAKVVGALKKEFFAASPNGPRFQESVVKYVYNLLEDKGLQNMYPIPASL